MDNTLHFYRAAKPARDKWPAASTAWFVVASCSLFWGGVIALAWRLL